MQFKKMSSILEYALWLLKRFNEQQKIQHDIYRVVEIKQSSPNQYKLIVQVIGKSMILECTPEEIVADDRMLEAFSRKDIRAITYLACAQSKKPKYKIVVQEFCSNLNKMLFKLKSNNSDQTIVKTADQISLDKDLINSLSHKDIQGISYIAGYEHSTNEKFEMDLAKQKSILSRS